MATEARERGKPASRVVIAALVAVGIAAGLAAWGTFGGEGENDSAGDYLAVLAIIAVAAAVVYGFIVPRALGGANAARTALILSVIGLVTVVVFWSGLPVVFAVAGIFTGVQVQQRMGMGATGQRRGLASAAVAVGVLALLADLIVYIADQN